MSPEEYKKLAKVEDDMWYFRALHAHVGRSLRIALPRGRPARILDAGCGTGGLVRRLGDGGRAWTWEAVDLSPEACRLASDRTGLKVREASVTALPFESASLDAIVSVDVLCQIEDPAPAVIEFFRVLRPGGILVLNLPACPSLWSYHDTCVGNLRRYRARELAPMLIPSGFRGVRCTHWNSLALPALWLKRRLFAPRQPVSDVAVTSLPVSLAMRGILFLETLWLELDFRFIAGASLLVVARKPLVEDHLPDSA